MGLFIFSTQGAALTLLNHKTIWEVVDLDLLSKFIDFKGQPRSRYSLALDGSAAVTPSSECTLTLSEEKLNVVGKNNNILDVKPEQLTHWRRSGTVGWDTSDALCSAQENNTLPLRHSGKQKK